MKIRENLHEHPRILVKISDRLSDSYTKEKLRPEHDMEPRRCDLCARQLRKKYNNSNHNIQIVAIFNFVTFFITIP